MESTLGGPAKATTLKIGCYSLCGVSGLIFKFCSETTVFCDVHVIFLQINKTGIDSVETVDIISVCSNLIACVLKAWN